MKRQPASRRLHANGPGLHGPVTLRSQTHDDCVAGMAPARQGRECEGMVKPGGEAIKEALSPSLLAAELRRP